MSEPNETDAQRFMRQCVKLTEELERLKAERDEYIEALKVCSIENFSKRESSFLAREVLAKWEGKE